MLKDVPGPSNCESVKVTFFLKKKIISNKERTKCTVFFSFIPFNIMSAIKLVVASKASPFSYGKKSSV
jgi:hypothetical protein